MLVLAIVLAAVLQPCGEARRPCSTTALHPAIMGVDADGITPGTLHRRAPSSSAECSGRFISLGAMCTARGQCRCFLCSARPRRRSCGGLLSARLRGGREGFSSDESEEVKRYGKTPRMESAVPYSAGRVGTPALDLDGNAQGQAHLGGVPSSTSTTQSIPPDLGGGVPGRGSAGGGGAVVAEAASTQWDDPGGGRVGEAGEGDAHAGMRREEEQWGSAEAAGPDCGSKLEVSMPISPLFFSPLATPAGRSFSRSSGRKSASSRARISRSSSPFLLLATWVAIVPSILRPSLPCWQPQA